MSVNRNIPRRTVLRGLGAALALPLLEAMSPSGFMSSSARAAAKITAPQRMAFCYIPNGAHMPDWTPTAVGADYELPYILEPLKPFKNDLLVLTNLMQDQAAAHGDGGGDHARASSCFLTGSHVVKTSGADIKVGISADQVAAAAIGDRTRLPSLEIGCEAGGQAGNCDSGYSCAYSSTISWKSSTTPAPKEINPRLVFERMFGGGSSEEADASRVRRLQRKTSILDYVQEDAKRLQAKVGGADNRKLDEYLTAVRELEARIQRNETLKRVAAPKNYEPPAGVPKEYPEHLKLMSDLLVLAFQADVTRVSTFVFANDGSNRSYPHLSISEGHHELSHHGGNKDKQAKIRQINQFHITQFADLLEKLKGIKEGEGSLLDNCMIVYGGGISDGDHHNHDKLPILLAGRGGGTIKPGRHIKYEKTPLNNLFLSMLDRVGVPTASLGDSTGKLNDLS